MEKAILFGASGMGKTAYEKLKDEYNIVYYTDNDQKKWEKNYMILKLFLQIDYYP